MRPDLRDYMAPWWDDPGPWPADVDGGLSRLELPLPPEDHYLHPFSDFNLYGRPPVPPWGSYLDRTPLPKHPDGRSALDCMWDALTGN